MKLTLTKTYNVPDGNYCIDCSRQNDNRCAELEQKDLVMEAEEGAVTRTPFTIYVCALFNKTPSIDFSLKPMRLFKLDECKEACSNGQ